MTKGSMIQTGEIIVKSLEAMRAAGFDNTADIEKMHRRCQDDYEHPDWTKYAEIIEVIRQIMDGKDPDWRSLYRQ